MVEERCSCSIRSVGPEGGLPVDALTGYERGIFSAGLAPLSRCIHAAESSQRYNWPIRAIRLQHARLHSIGGNMTR